MFRSLRPYFISEPVMPRVAQEPASVPILSKSSPTECPAFPPAEEAGTHQPATDGDRTDTQPNCDGGAVDPGVQERRP